MYLKKFMIAFTIVAFFVFAHMIGDREGIFRSDVKVYAATEVVLLDSDVDEGYALIRKRNYKGAVLKFTNIIKSQPNFEEAYTGRGFAYLYLKNYSQSISDFTKAIEIHSSNIDHASSLSRSYYGRGSAYFSLGISRLRTNGSYMENYGKAIKDFEAAFKLFPNNKNYKEALIEAYEYTADEYYDQENHGKVVQIYSRIIEIAPNYAEAYQNRGISYKELGKTKQAQADFAKAKQLGYKNKK